MKILKKYILLLLLLPTMAWGQELMVRDFYLDAEDLSAVQEQVLDHNNKPCALIKVRLPDYQLFFEGDVIYWENKGNNEYWVYMSSGATWLQIKSPVASPLTYDFILPVEGLRTYIMQLHLTLSRAYRQTFSSTQELLASSFKEDKNEKNKDNDNALVKVRLESFALSFSGDIVQVVPKWNEYWVYLSDGATRFEIHCSVAPPLTYDFERKLKKGHTYVLQLELKNPVTLPKSQSTTKTNTYSTATTTPKNSSDKWMKNFLEIQYAPALNFKSHEYGLRYGRITDFMILGWYSGISIASSTPSEVYNEEYGYIDTTYSNSENLHIVLGGLMGGDKLAAALGLGFAFGTGANGHGGFVFECGIMAHIENFILSVDYEPTMYFGTYSGVGHYLKFGIGYTF